MAHKDVFFGWRSRLQTVSGATLALIVTGTLTRLITSLTQIVIAREFGLSVLSDAYFATENVPELFMGFVVVGLSMVFIPVFTGYRVTRGEDEAWRFASSFFFLSAFVSFIFALIAAVGAPLLVSVIAPGFHGLARQTAVKLVRIMSLSIVFFGLDAGIRGLLQSHKEFIVPELARVVYNSVLFVFALTLGGGFGVSILAWGIVLGAALQLAIQFLGAVKRGVFKLVWVFGHPGVGQAAKQLVPFLIAISGVQITFVLDRMVASGLAEGSVTALTYANRIILLPVGLFALPLRTTLYPDLSALAARSQLHQLAETILWGLQVLLFLVIPSCVGLVVLSTPLIQLLFERGAFDSLATLATSKALIYYAAGVPSIATILLLNNVYLSLGNASSLAKLCFFNWLTNLSLSLLLSQYLGHCGIALGTSVSVTLTMILMIHFLKRRQLKAFDVKSLLSSVYKIASVSAVMGLQLALLVNMSNHISVQPLLHYQFLRVAILIFVGTLTYLIIGRWLKLDGLTMLSRTFHKS